MSKLISTDFLCSGQGVRLSHVQISIDALLYVSVAESPKLYDPHVLTIAFQAYDIAHASQTTPVVCRVSSGNPESSTFYNSYRINNGVVTTLQQLIQKYLHQSAE
jgi:hypothetical protein